MKSWHFGIVTDCYGIGIPLEKAIGLLCEIGFRDVEISSVQFADDLRKPPAGKAIAERLCSIRKLLDDLNMTVWQFHGPYGSSDLVSNSEQSRRCNVDVHKRWLDIAQALGARSHVIHIGGKNDICGEKELSAILEGNARSLAELAAHAGDSGCRLAIENLMTRDVRLGWKISHLKELIAATGSDRIGICLDTGHANVEGVDVPTAVEECGSLLIATHIQESRPGDDLHMYPFSQRPARSGMDWFKIFRAFKAIGYRNPLIGECGNSGGKLPIALVSLYLKSQKHIIERVMRGDFDRE